jgi:FkbM family methyltransferase
MSTVSIADAKFVDRLINGKHRVKMPAFLAAHDSFDNWERERFDSMERNLKQGDVLFDVGAETGHMSAIYARFVGAENMVLFEPNPDNWQNIKATWDVESLATPRATVCALVGNRNSVESDFDTSQENGWPVVALTGQIWTPRSFRYIHEHAARTPQISIDVFVATRVVAPNAITIDVEGAELEVLKGALLTLQECRPLVWVSVHEELMRRDYGRELRDIASLMVSAEYYGEYLATDHEAHWLYRPY